MTPLPQAATANRSDVLEQPVGCRWNERSDAVEYAVSRRARAAEVVYDSAQRDLLDRLRDLRESAIQRFDDALAALPHEARRAGEARADALALAARFAAYEDHLEECGNTLLSSYRDSNRSARASTAPAHFSERWQLAPRGEVQVRASAGPDAVSLDPALAEIRQLHDELLAEYEALLAEAEGKPQPGQREP